MQIQLLGISCTVYNIRPEIVADDHSKAPSNVEDDPVQSKNRLFKSTIAFVNKNRRLLNQFGNNDVGDRFGL